VTSTKCRIDTVISPDDGNKNRPKHVKKKNEHSKKNYAPSWLYLQDLQDLQDPFLTPEDGTDRLFRNVSKDHYTLRDNPEGRRS
jgi:hypothetical protein